MEETVCRAHGEGQAKVYGAVGHEHQRYPDHHKGPQEHELVEESLLVLQEVARARPRRNGDMSVLVIAALPQRSMPGRRGVELGRGQGRRLARVGLGKAVGAVLDHLEDAGGIALDQGPVQRGEALLVGGMDVGAPSQEDVHQLREALVGRPHERRVAVAVEDVDRDALVEQQHDEQHVAVEGRDVEGVVALGVGDERVGAALEQQVDGVEVASLGCPLQRRRNGLAALFVELGAVLDEERAHGILVVDGSPLEDATSVGALDSVSDCGFGYRTALTCSGVMPSPSVYVASNSPDSNSFSMPGMSPMRASCMMSFSGAASSAGRLPISISLLSFGTAAADLDDGCIRKGAAAAVVDEAAEEFLMRAGGLLLPM